MDFKPTCGNMLSGVGPAAIEMGIVAAQDGETIVKIHAVNVGARVEAKIKTDGGEVVYEGNTAIDGVPGTAAPIELNFMDIVGSATGSLLPTGTLRNVIDGIEVTCMDVAMPMVIARAADFGLTGYENAEELDSNQGFFDKMEAIRINAGALMGMGDVSRSVIPKFGLLAPARDGGTIAARYFVPWKAHPTMAVTGAQCLVSCALAAGTISDGLLKRPQTSPATIVLEHASGAIAFLADYEISESGLMMNSAGLVRTARKLADGHVFVPLPVWGKV